jgi:uncharacterized protein
MKKLYLFLCICIGLNGTAQKFYFPKSFYKDSASIATHMPVLAKSLIKVYYESDQIAYFSNLYRYQIVAKEYESSIKSIKAMRKIEYAVDLAFGESVAAHFENYCQTLIKDSTKNFSTNYLQLLKQNIEGLNDRAAHNFANYHIADLQNFKASFYKNIHAIVSTKDSISIDLAKKLCRTYNSYLVFTQIIPAAKSYAETFIGNQLVIQDSIFIKTRDGATLSGQLVRKKNQVGKQPCILTFSIYPSPNSRRDAIDAALRGYVGVMVYNRGKYLSNDSLIPYENEAEDAYDAIDWISKQPWSNGKVGMQGGSHLGYSQWAAAKSLHPSLKTIVPMVPEVPGIESVYRGRMFATNELPTIYFFNSSKYMPGADFYDDTRWSSLYDKWYQSGLSIKSLDSLDGRPNPIFQKWLKHPSFDAYWQKMIPYKQDYAKINIPILTITGHFDGNLRGSFYYFHEHYKYNPKANHYIVFGPYDHFGSQGYPTDFDDYKIDSVAKINIEQLVYDWFDFVLKDKPKPSFLKDKINYQVMDKNIWKHKPNMKSISNDSLKLYLGSDSINGVFSLLNSKPKSLSYFIQKVDFKNRSDTNFAGNPNFLSKVINTHCAQLFISEPLKEDIEVSGEFMLQLNAMINKKDMDIDVTMYETLPNGTDYFWLSEVCGRASYLKDISKRNLITPNIKVSLPIMTSRFISKIIHKGSRVVILLAIPKDRAREINYGTGKDVSTESIKDAGEPLQIKWYNDSYIKIPVWRDKK